MKLPNQFGSIEKLKGKRRKPYMVRKTIGWDSEGKQIRKILGFYETRQQALQSLAVYNENPYNIDAKNITVGQLYEKWKNEKYPKIAHKTQVVYNMCWNYCKDIETLPLVEIRLTHLQAIVDGLDNKWSAKKAFKNMWNQLFDFAMKNDINVKKYSTFIDVGKKTTKLVRIPFEENEIDLMWNNLNRMDFVDTILILIYTGMRVGELLDIKIENVHLDQKYMIGGSKTEAGKDRVIPIHDRILPLVEKWYVTSKSHNCEYLIHNYEYDKMSYWNYYHEKWEKIIEQLELGDTHKPHDTRHTFATRMDRTDANKLCIKRIMGHASTDVTDKVYTHKDIEDLIETVNKLR